MFTRQHYKAIAEVLKANKPKVIAGIVDPKASGRLQQHWAVVLGLASLFAQDNPRFDRDKFIWACGASQHAHEGNATVTGR